MTDTLGAVTGPHAPGLRAEHLYPALTPAQVARIAAHGKPRRVEAGEMLIQAGERIERFFVVGSGQIDVVHDERTITAGS